MGEFRDQLVKQHLYKGIRNLFIYGIIFALIWGTLNIFVPEGWWMAAVNIICFLISILIFWWPLESFFKMTMPSWLAIIVATLLWGAIFMGLRSILLALFN